MFKLTKPPVSPDNFASSFDSRMFSKTFSALLLTALASAVSASPALQARQGSGLARFYFPDGGIGACGNALQNSDFIVALGPDTWDDGAHCGQTIDVQPRQNCPSHCGRFLSRLPGRANVIDLSEGAIAALDPNYINDGVISVVWSFA
ncbi:hypothetical protein MSAN_01982100 [Mycena sanguinolenta]|uniref:RlpA-like protein double-psi beta-barrel domain-containing protein n=1 Tax=Mycena sanguinolenta TaxID=230812 RepID=A0A8H7CMW1_9AGAR|nr:hypothetical protein MSAN_01982100 [Mycena sanguinolenta]